MTRKRSVWIWLLPCSLLASACQERIFNNPRDPNAETGIYELLATLDIQGIIPEDLAFSDDALWVCDISGRIIALNYNSGQLIRELNVNRSVAGIAYDGANLWLTLRDSATIQRVNIVTGALLRELRLARGDLAGLDWHSDKLYIADRLSNSVLVVDPLTGDIEQTIVHPGFSLDGVAYDGSALWTTDGSQMAIYRYNTITAAITSFIAPDRRPAGLSASAGYIWLGDSSGRIYKLRFH